MCLSRGRITPPSSSRVVLSLTDSHSTVQCLAARFFFLISLKEKLSTSSSMTFWSMGGVLFLLQLVEVLKGTRDNDQESPRSYYCVTF